MITSEVIVVGGGPAGSSCAWRLVRAGRETLLLDRAAFPRPKPCAGWITPRVLRALNLALEACPFGIRPIRTLHLHFPSFTIPLPTRQYAVRRVEFDAWLVGRSGVSVERHEVRRIRRENGGYVLDETWRCRTLVGAGGTTCPVRRAVFGDAPPRPAHGLVVALDAEFPQVVRDGRTHLWFGEAGLPGYAWYVPKEGGWVNVGIGGRISGLKARGVGLRWHWDRLLERLFEQGLVDDPRPVARGHAYPLRIDTGPIRRDGCYLLGDAAGLATVDLGEGIGPAVESGFLAAEAILRGTAYSVASIPRRSLPALLFPGLGRVARGVPPTAPG
ncbi:MAG: NAD(P)/FAD-dependent oxidoreductase [Deltaproteobacteria bacterium]|nr:NAD(P)/FAD-dependent oxidoreductase [Deltaproteobacteria bacterium]